MTQRTTDNIHAQLGSTGVPTKTKILMEVPHGTGVSYLCAGGVDAPGVTNWVDVLTADTAEVAVTKIQAKIKK